MIRSFQVRSAVATSAVCAVGVALPFVMCPAVAAAQSYPVPIGCPHDGKINGVRAQIQCGPAKATMHFGGKRVLLRNGLCQGRAPFFDLNFGALYLGKTSKTEPNSFAMSSSDGHGGTLQIHRGGKAYMDIDATMTLAKNRMSGTISGTLTLIHSETTVPVKVSFHC